MMALFASWYASDGLQWISRSTSSRDSLVEAGYVAYVARTLCPDPRDGMSQSVCNDCGTTEREAKSPTRMQQAD